LTQEIFVYGVSKPNWSACVIHGYGHISPLPCFTGLKNHE
jgi:hypothetical protein